MLVLHAHIKVNPNHREEYLEHARNVMEGSKAEEGNISYHFYEDILDKNQFVVVEEWQDMAALEFHFGTAHYNYFKEATNGMLAETPRLVKYEVK